MYGTAGAAGAALPLTGLLVDLSWLIVGGVTLIAVGFALYRLAPRKEA